MTPNSRFSRFFMAAVVAALMMNLTLTPAHAKGGATDPIPGTSKSGLSSGGGSGSGGGGSGGGSTTTTSPTPIVSATLTFSASGPINGVLPVCTGSYHIDPYYPTLSLCTVNLSASSVNVPDGTILYVSIVGTGGTIYPFTSNTMAIVTQSGTSSYSAYVTPGTTITGVLVSDAAGNIIFAGN